MGVFFNKIDRKQLKPGDHIYSWMQAYLFAHHGIYVGKGMVINFTTRQESGLVFTSSALSSFDTDIPCPRCGECNQTRTHSVFKSCLECFLSGGEIYLYQYGVSYPVFIAQARGGTCTLASSDPTEEVLHCAIYLLENGFGGYHIFKNNCENFAVYCKTGLLVTTNISVAGGSGQAATYSAAVTTIASLSLRFVSFYGMPFVGCGTYCYKRLVSDIGYRKGVTKVPVEKIAEMAKVEN